ncbi:MAG: MgtC/SapB family protein [Fusobacteriota bacterium]
MDLTITDMFIRVVLAAITGGIIGLEREVKSKPAGFITHTLLCVGAAVISMIQVKLTFETLTLLINNPQIPEGTIGLDTGRLIAQVISGVGFLGAGTIIRNRGSVRGITTAATLWLTACLGIAVGLGYFVLALGTAILMTVVVLILQRVELYHIEKRVKENIIITYIADKKVEEKIKLFLESKKVKIRKKEPLSEIYNGEDSERKTKFLIMVPKFIDLNNMLMEMKNLEGVTDLTKLT